MEGTAPARRGSVATRRVGYVIAALCDATLLYLVNAWPGWQAVSFLTEDTRQVLGLINLSLAVGLAANLVYLAQDGPRLKALGDLVTTGIGLGVLVRIWQVFPFDFADWSHDWSWLLRVLLGVGMVGSVIGIAVQFISLVRQLANGGAHPGSGTAASPPVH
jgi:hypothetical protein